MINSGEKDGSSGLLTLSTGAKKGGHGSSGSIVINSNDSNRPVREIEIISGHAQESSSGIGESLPIGTAIGKPEVESFCLPECEDCQVTHLAYDSVEEAFIPSQDPEIHLPLEIV